MLTLLCNLSRCLGKTHHMNFVSFVNPAVKTASSSLSFENSSIRTTLFCCYYSTEVINLTKVYQHSITKSTAYLLENLNSTDGRGSFFREDPYETRTSIFLFSRSIDFMTFSNTGQLSVTPFIQRSYINAFGNTFLYLFFFTLLILNFEHPGTIIFLRKALPNINILYEQNKNFNCSWRGISTQFALKEAIASLLCHLIPNLEITYCWPTIGANSLIRDFIEVLFMQNIHCQSTKSSDNPNDWVDSLELDDKIIEDDSDNFLFIPSKKGILLFVPKILLKLPDDSFPVCIPLIYDEKVAWQEALDFEINKNLEFKIKPVSRYPSMPNSDYLDGKPVFLDHRLFSLIKASKNEFGCSGVTFSTASELAPDSFTKSGAKQDAFLMYALPDEVTKIVIQVFVTIITFLNNKFTMESKNNILVTFIKNPALFEKFSPHLDLPRFHKVISQLATHSEQIYYRNMIDREVQSFYTNILSGLMKTQLLGGTGLSLKEQQEYKIFSKVFFFKSCYFLPLPFEESFCTLFGALDIIDTVSLIGSILSARFTLLRLILLFLMLFLFIQILVSESIFQIRFEYRRQLPQTICGIALPFGYLLSRKIYNFYNNNKVVSCGGLGGIIVKDNLRALVDFNERDSCNQIIVKSPFYQGVTNKQAAEDYFSKFLSGDFVLAKDTLSAFNKVDFFSIMRLRAYLLQKLQRESTKKVPNNSEAQDALTQLLTKETTLLKSMCPTNIHLPLSNNCLSNLAWGESSCHFSVAKSLIWQIGAHIKKQKEYIQLFEIMAGTTPVTFYNATSDLRRTDFLQQQGHSYLSEQALSFDQYPVSMVFKMDPSRAISGVDVTGSLVTKNTAKRLAQAFFEEKMLPLSCLDVQQPPYTLLEKHITAHLITCDQMSTGELFINEVERLLSAHTFARAGFLEWKPKIKLLEDLISW